MEHLAFPETAFRSMAQTLRPEGWLFVTVPFFEINHGAPHDFHRFTLQALFMYAYHEQMCVHKIGKNHLIVEGMYTLSYLIAQKQPCEQSSEPLAQYDLQQLIQEVGYVI